MARKNKKHKVARLPSTKLRDEIILLSRIEKLGFLAETVRDENQDIRVRLAAIELDNKMQGHLAPQEIGVSINAWAQFKREQTTDGADC